MSKLNSQVRAIDLFEMISANKSRSTFLVRVKNINCYEFVPVVLCEKIPCLSFKTGQGEDSILFTCRNEKTGHHFKKRFGFNYYIAFICK